MLLLNVKAISRDTYRHQIQRKPRLRRIIRRAHIIKKPQIHIRCHPCLQLKAILARNASPARNASQASLTAIVDHWHALLPKAEILPISAKNKFGTDILLKRIQELLPESPAYFDKDQLTDKPARFFVSEIIREKILLYYDKEIPYSVEVSVERFKEDEKHIHINAIIYVERDSQKGIIIGHQGVALKKVSTEARKALEKFFDKPIYLEVFVKVDKDWRSNERELNHFGYNPE